MDPNQWGDRARLVDTPSNEQTMMSNFLMAAAQRGAARRNSDHTILEALIAAGRSVQQPDLQSILDRGQQQQDANGDYSMLENEHWPLRIPSRSEELPSIVNMQLTNIQQPHPHDVLYGRGFSIKDHAGNKHYRELVESKRVEYQQSSKVEKACISEDIVRAVRAQNPPGRFLSRVEAGEGTWFDIGETKAREKTAQALRENIRESINEQLPPRKRKLIHENQQTLPMHSQPPVTAAEQLVARSTQAGAASLLSGQTPLAAAMALAQPGTAMSDVNVARKQSEEDVAMATLARAVSLSSSGTSLHSNSSNHSQKATTPAAEQLAAEIMTAHVQQQAKAARMLAAAQASARAAPAPLGMVNPRVSLFCFVDTEWHSDLN